MTIEDFKENFYCIQCRRFTKHEWHQIVVGVDTVTDQEVFVCLRCYEQEQAYYYQDEEE